MYCLTGTLAISCPTPEIEEWAWSIPWPDILSPSLYFLIAIFPGEFGLASFIGAKADGSGGGNWSYKTCKAPVKSSHNQQTNT